MRKSQIQGNDCQYYVSKKGIEIWRYADWTKIKDWWIDKKDIPFLKKAIKLLQEKSK
jgi:hypothetical protein